MSAFGQKVIITTAGTGIAGYSGDGGPARYSAINHTENMVLDNSATPNLYFTESGNHRVRRVDGVTGVITTVAGTGVAGFSGDGGAATLAQLNYPIGLAFDASGNLYVLEQLNYRVRKIDTTGKISTFAGNGSNAFAGDGSQATSASFSSGHGIVFDSNGNLYIGDQGNNRVRMVNTSGVMSTFAGSATVAGSGVGASIGDGGAATAAKLSQPNGLAVDASNNVYISEYNQNRVRVVSASTGNITTFAGKGSSSCLFSGDGLAPTAADLCNPLSLSFSSGTLYIADRGNNRVRTVTGNVITTIAGNGAGTFVGDGGSPTATSINQEIQAIADPSGNVYIADWANFRIRKIINAPTTTSAPVLTALQPSNNLTGVAAFPVTIYGTGFLPGAVASFNGAPRTTNYVSPTILSFTILATDVQSGGSTPITVLNPGSSTVSNSQTFTAVTSPPTTTNTLITTFAGNGTSGFAGDGGPAVNAEFQHIETMAFDPAGNLYAADIENGVIRKITPAGVISTVAGGGASNLENIPATAAALSTSCCNGLAVDPSGTYLYIAEYAGNRIRRVNLSTGSINTFAGPTPAAGTITGFSGDGGQALQATFNNPLGMVFDTSGNLFVVDRNNNRIRKIDTTGIITTIAGNGISAYFGDGGPALYAPLTDPVYITRDSANNLYVADYAGHRVRKIDTGGTIYTVAGTTVGGYTGDGGLAINAQFNSPTGIGIDANNNLFISDSSNQRIRIVSPGGIVATVAGTGGTSSTGDGGLATAALLSSRLEGLAIDSSGQIYIADSNNFRIRRLQQPSSNNPVPTLTQIVPQAIVAASAGFTLRVYGANFVPGAIVQWNGSARATTFVSPTRLNATINNFDVANVPGTQPVVTVLNPTTGGGTSNALTFTIISGVTPPTGLIITYAGNGGTGLTGNGGPAVDAGVDNPQGIVFDTAGNLYIAEYRNYVVRKIAPDGTTSILAGTGAVSSNGDNGPANFATVNGPVGLAIDNVNGILYIGEYDGSRIRKVVLSTNIITTIAGNGSASFSGDGGQAIGATFNRPEGLAVDPAGNLYIADYNNQRVRKITFSTGIITTVAGTGVATFAGDGGPAVTTPLYNPVGIAVDTLGNLYIADQYNHRIRKVDTNGIITTVAGNGAAGFNGDGVPAIFAQLYYPNGVAVDAAGNIYIGDSNDNRVRKVNTLGIISTIAGSGSGAFNGDGGLATSAGLNSPTFMAIDAQGNVYVTDNNNNRIREIVPAASGTTAPVLNAMTPSAAVVGGPAFTIAVSGTNFVPGATVVWNGSTRNTIYISSSKLTAVINTFDINTIGTFPLTVFNPGGGGSSNSLSFNVIATPTPPTAVIVTIAGNGIGSFSGDGGPAIFANLGNTPQGLVYDGAGNLYVADYTNNRVRKVTAGGTITTFAGTGAAGSNGDGGPASFAQINHPVGLAVDSSGNVYISEQNGARVRQVTPGGLIFTVAGNGSAGFSGDGGSATGAQLNAPQGLAVDAAGNLYIAEQNSHRVRKVTPGGIISTFAGTGGTGYNGDGGPAFTATLYYPSGVSTDAAGNVYIADQYNHRIRKVDTSGNISTVAGTGNASFNGDGISATTANLYYPTDVHSDAQGNLYIADYYDQRIRKVTNTGIISTVAGNGGTASYSGDGGLATNANLNYPAFVTLDPSGVVVLSDTSNNRIRKLIPATASNASTPTPVISNLTPSKTQVGGAALTVIIYGSNFVPGAIAQYNGVQKTTLYISPNFLYMTLNPADVSVTNIYSVTVLNPGTGGVSGGLSFTVYPPPATPTALIQTIAGTTYNGYSTDGGPALFSALNSPEQLIFDAAGNILVADFSNNRVRKINLVTGIITTVVGTGSATSGGDNGPATLAQINSPTGLALDTFGNLYITEYNGHRIRKVTAGGIITTYAGTGVAGYGGDGSAAIAAQFNHPHGLAVDSSGNLYVADNNNHRIRKIDTSGNISTYAGNGISGYFGDGGPATTTSLANPCGIALDLAGNLYIGDSNNHRIRKVAPDGTIFTVAGTGSAGYSGDGGIAIRANIYSPVGVFVDTAGNLIIGDYNNSRVRLVSGGIITTIGGNGTNNFAGDGSLATNANLSNPTYVLEDLSGNVYVSDTGNSVIRKIAAPPTGDLVPTITGLLPDSAQQGGATFTMVLNGTNFVPGSTVQWNGFNRATTLIGPNQLTAVVNNFDIALVGTNSVTVVNPSNGGGGGTSNAVSFLVYPTPVASTAVINAFAGTTNGFSGDNTPASGAQMNNPHMMTFDASGTLYFADYTNNRVRKITNTGTISTVAGGGSGLNEGGQATGAALTTPVGVAVDGLGNLYFGEFAAHRVRKVVLSTGIITTIAGNGVAGFAGDGGPALNSQLNNPDGMAVDAQGNLYIAEYRNYRIRKITSPASGGTISTIAGTGGSVYLGDGGPAIDSPLVGPAALAFDVAGNLYVTEYDGHRIRKIDTNGNISLFAGVGGASFGGDGGPAIYAHFNNPYGLAIDNAGNVFVADRFNYRIRKIDVTNIITTVAGNGSAGLSGDGNLATGAQLNQPTGIALDAAGNLFIADEINSRIRRVGAVTGTTCLYSINPSSLQFGAAATTTSISLTTSAGCFWSASSNAPWLTITSATANSGPSSVSVSVAANTNAASRVGTMIIAGQTFTGTQAGTGCSFQLGPTSANVVSSASTGNTVTVTAPGGCTWTAVSNASFIHITSGTSGTGTGQVTYSVDPNQTSGSLNGSMTIAGQVFPVTQAGSTCTYSLLTTSANYTSSASTGTVGVLALTGCGWTANSSQSWLTITSGTSGNGNGFVAYSLAANTLATSRSATITVAGINGLIFTVNQQAFVSPVGNVGTLAATGAPGGSARIPVILTMPTGQLDSISFGVLVTPVGGAPALSASFSFAADSALPTPSLVDSGAPGAISIFFQSLATPISGTVSLGQLQVTIPSSAVIGQSYTISVTGANGSSAGANVSLSSGATSTLLLTNTFLVGDTFPFLTDITGDGTLSAAGEFGDGLLNNLDLIYALRQVVSIPGFTAPTCSDRFDGMDSFPVDTISTRGGNGVVDNLDLISTLRRVTNIDTSRPIRGTRGLVCGQAVAPEARIQPIEGPAVGSITLDAADSNGRVPVYLNVSSDMQLGALTFSVGGGNTKLRFVPVDGVRPSLADNGVDGYLALAWLTGLQPVSGRTLIGYVEGAGDATLRISGINANAGGDNHAVRVNAPEAR